MPTVTRSSIAWALGAVALAVAGLGQAATSLTAPATYFYFVFSNPVAGREDEYNHWYDEQHAPDVVSIPGFLSAQRFVLSDVQLRPGEVDKPKYLVVYEIVSADLPAVRAEVARRLSSGQTRMSSSLDPGSAVGLTYQALDRKSAGAGGEPSAAKSAALQIYYQFVFADPVPGREQQFNTWYETHHAPEVASSPGFVSWQRARLAEVQMNPVASAARYLTLFEIRTTDIAAVIDEFRRRAPSMSDSSAFDGKRVFGYTYRAIGPKLDGQQIRAQRAH